MTTDEIAGVTAVRCAIGCGHSLPYTRYDRRQKVQRNSMHHLAYYGWVLHGDPKTEPCEVVCKDCVANGR